ncbi:MAG: LemA family protein [Gemmatimonadota bacterium]|nr:LemA family protein [Gemmatimonadota bacterium]
MRLRWLAPLSGALMVGCGYNTIQSMDERAASAKQQIEVQLQRRSDLIGNLVNTVKRYAEHEEAVFTGVAEARARVASAVQSGDPTQMEAANAQLTGALGRLIAVSERYPDLKADRLFLQLQDELAGTENRIAVARQDYNEAARDYNSYIRQFPQNLTAKATGAKPRPYFEASAEAGQAPRVDFGSPTGTSGSNPGGRGSSGSGNPR